MPNREDCIFYHTMDFPDGEQVTGVWDIRGQFASYVGDYPLAGKTLVDIGAASGFLTFCAEQAGATVTAFDADDPAHYDRIPFGKQIDRDEWLAISARRSAFWYAHAKFNSRADALYGTIRELGESGRAFDVVLAGAIVEHLSDPVAAIGHFAAIANEAVIIAFTPVVESEELRMDTMNDWTNPQFDYSWWKLSRGLYKRVFSNLGFYAEFRPASAVFSGVHHGRSTIVARRHQI